MTTTKNPSPNPSPPAGRGVRIAPAERAGGQGLDGQQEESGNRAIYELLTHETAGRQTDFVATYRDGAYEVWSRRGMIGFQRLLADGGGYEYRIVEQIGENPIENQDPHALGSLAEEDEAARRSGKFGDDVNSRWIDPEHLSYPYGYERIAQLFDSPNGPDIVHNPLCYTFGRSPGQHGALDVVQSRAPLIFSGPGVAKGRVFDDHSRQIDIAPTIARLLGWPLIDGRDMTGRTSSERGVEPDVYFKRQDGVALDIVDDGTLTPTLSLEGEGDSTDREVPTLSFEGEGDPADLHVEVMRTPDGRNIRVTVLQNDADESGERAPVEGAEVVLSLQGEKVAEGVTDEEGMLGLPVSVEYDSADYVLRIEKDGFNPRHVRGDGTNVVMDLREMLYGATD